jgi:hypothetical protein
MVYKADFRPAEVLGADGVWRPMDRQRGEGAAPAAGDPKRR